MLELKFNPFRRGRGLWKFNNYLLTDKDYVQKVKNVIKCVSNQYLENAESKNFQCKNNMDESLFLEVLLMEIRGNTISYSSYIKKEKDQKEKTLLQEIEDLESDAFIDLNKLDEKKRNSRVLEKKSY